MTRKFGETDNVVSLTDVWVSDLALVTRTRDGRIEGFVLQADSGEPVTGRRGVRLASGQPGQPRRRPDPDAQTRTGSSL